MIRNAVLAGDFHPLVIVLEDEVDDAGHGVRTVHRRGAAGDDVDALDEAGRDGADVDDARGRRSRNALAVDEDQGTIRADAAKVEGGEVFTALVVRRAGVARNELRKFVQEGFDGDRTGQVESLRIDGGDGARSVQLGTDQARTGNDDGVVRILLGFRRNRRLLFSGRSEFRCSAARWWCPVRTPVWRSPRRQEAREPAMRQSHANWISSFQSPESDAPWQVRHQFAGANHPHVGCRLAWKWAVLSSAERVVCQLLLRHCDSGCHSGVAGRIVP